MVYDIAFKKRIRHLWKAILKLYHSRQLHKNLEYDNTENKITSFFLTDASLVPPTLCTSLYELA